MNAIAMLETCGIRQFEQEGAHAHVLIPVTSGEPSPYTGDHPFLPEEEMGRPDAVPLGSDLDVRVGPQ